LPNRSIKQKAVSKGQLFVFSNGTNSGVGCFCQQELSSTQLNAGFFEINKA
jgi:hypothetical protein